MLLVWKTISKLLTPFAPFLLIAVIVMSVVVANLFSSRDHYLLEINKLQGIVAEQTTLIENCRKDNAKLDKLVLESRKAHSAVDAVVRSKKAVLSKTKTKLEVKNAVPSSQEPSKEVLDVLDMPLDDSVIGLLKPSNAKAL